MIFESQTGRSSTVESRFQPENCPRLQRKCACGGTPGPTGECAECKRKRLSLQPKLAVNRPGDQYEQEADRVAEAVVGGTASERPAISSLGKAGAVQRAGEEPGFHPGTSATGTRSSLGPYAPDFKLSSETQTEEPRKKEEETLQRKSVDHDEVSGAPPIVDHVLQRPGQPLDPTTRTFMEERFGYDFGQVRIHADVEAASSAREVRARAYTVGREVVFSANEYQPSTIAGRRLLAHELVHTVQQSGSAPKLQRSCPGLNARFRKRQAAALSNPLADPCRTHNPKDCCDELDGCDRKGAVETALDNGRTRLDRAIEKLDKLVIGRELRGAFRQLFGKRRFKRKVLATLCRAQDWLKDVTVPQSSPENRKGADAKSATSGGEAAESRRAPEKAPLEESAPLELPNEPAPLEEDVPRARGGSLPAGVPGAGSGGVPTPPGGNIPALSKAKRPSPCVGKEKTVLCGVPCGATCSPGILATTLDGVVVVCPASFDDKPEFQEATMIHEAMHNAIEGPQRDIYSHTRLFRVLAQARDSEGVAGGIARQAPDSYAALVLAATGIGVDEFIRGQEGAPEPKYEGFGLHRRQRAPAGVALGFASAGITKAYELVESLIIGGSGKSASEDAKTAAGLLRNRGLLTADASGDRPDAQKDRLREIKKRLEKMRIGQASVRTIDRLDSFEPASYASGALSVTKRFFALNSERSQTREIIQAFVDAAAVKPAQSIAYLAFIEDAINLAKGLSSLPSGSSDFLNAEEAGAADTGGKERGPGVGTGAAAPDSTGKNS